MRHAEGTGSRDCITRKRRFEKLEAERWLAQYRQTKHPRAPRMRVYKCSHCGDYHLTKWQSWAPRKVNGRVHSW